MVRKATKQQRALRQARGQARARAAKPLGTPPAPENVPTTNREMRSVLRREAAAACGWCGGPIQHKATGRIPK